LLAETAWSAAHRATQPPALNRFNCNSAFSCQGIKTS
jgi:hypothetical protein